MDIGRILEDVLIPEPVIDEERFHTDRSSVRTLPAASTRSLLSDLLETAAEPDNATTSVSP